VTFFSNVILSEERRSRTESKDPTWQRRSLRELFHDTVAKNVSTVVASQADLGCFDFTAACAALALSKTAVEKTKESQTLSEVEGSSTVRREAV